MLTSAGPPTAGAGAPRRRSGGAVGVSLTDEHDRKLGALVELDLGTMSHVRLRQKADLYATYAAAEEWREHSAELPYLAR